MLIIISLVSAGGFADLGWTSADEDTGIWLWISEHNLAIDKDGNVWAWGSNEFGQLGDGTSVDRDSPVRVTILPS